MMYCKKCNVSINGEKRCCPLCQGTLLGEPSLEAYPQIEQPRYSRHFLIRLISFISIALGVICTFINVMLPTEIYWCLFADAGILCGWITAIIGITYRKRLISNIMMQLFIVTIMCFIWDKFTGWHKWSIDFVLPCSCFASTVAICVISIVKKLPKSEYIMFLIINGIYGLVPLIFIVKGVLNIIYPSAICTALSIILVSAIFLFEGRSVSSEISKKMHL
ncbi:MAG: DUF6320 domain-containing protein [Oscillospiraceae bacterium]